MIITEYLSKPIQIVQYHGQESIKLVPDMIVDQPVADTSDVSLDIPEGSVVLLTAQYDSYQNGMYVFNNSSLEPYYFEFFNNLKKVYKISSQSSYEIYNNPTDKFNQFSIINPNDSLIVIQKDQSALPYLWYSYSSESEPVLQIDKKIIESNFCALNALYNSKTNEVILDLKNLVNQPLVLTSKISQTNPEENYTLFVDVVKSPDPTYKNVLKYTDLLQGEDFTIDENGNLVLNQSLVSNGLNGINKLRDFAVLYSLDENFVKHNLIQINNGLIYEYDPNSYNPYTNLTQSAITNVFKPVLDSQKIVNTKQYILNQNTSFLRGMADDIYVNSTLYLSKAGEYEIRARLLDSNLSLISEDRYSFSIKQVLNLPTPTPTPSSTPIKHNVVFDVGPILDIGNCEDCYMEYISATINNLSPEGSYYYEFGVFAYGNVNPDEPRDNTIADDISLESASGIINTGNTSENIKCLMSLGIGKIRTTLYVKVINLDNHIVSTSYTTIQKCDRDFCGITPTPTPSNQPKSYPARTPTKTKTPTPTQTATNTSTPTPTPTTPLLPPNTPTNLVGVAGNTTVSLSWTAPTSSIIRDYVVQYSLDSGSNWITFSEGVSLSTSVVITGLTNSTPYLFRVAASNGAGVGSYVTTGSSITPLAVPPSAPVISSTNFGNQQISVTWTAPTSNGGASITNYIIDYSSTGGLSWTTFSDGTSTATSATITGLVNGASYLVRVSAVNIAGTGAHSANSSPIVPATVPDPPTNISVVTGNTTVSLSWSAPASNGGRAITDYIIQYSSNSGSSWTTFNDGTNTNTFANVTGLVNGTGYLFRAAATNSIGNSSYLTTLTTNTPAGLPGTPTSVTAAASDSQAVVSWSAPSANGSPITDYVIRYSTNNGTSWTIINDGVNTNTSYTVTGLTNGLSIIFGVAAVNSIGTGSYSANSAAVVPSTSANAPTGLTVTALSTSASLLWTTPTDTGGLSIIDYSIQYSSDSGSTWTSFPHPASSARSITVTGLVNGTSYIFRVAAITGVGAGVYSSSSSSVTPAGVPTAISISPNPSVGNGQITLSISGGNSNGSPITDYSVQISTNNSTWNGINDGVNTSTSIVVTGLSNGTLYYFRAAAVNSIGTGTYSTVVSAVPGAAPATIGTISVAPSNTSVNLSWTAPANNGYSITSYIVQYSVNNNTWTTFTGNTSSQPSMVVTSLVNGTSYFFRVAAVNALGTGSYSSSVGPFIPATTPLAPTLGVITSGNTQLTINWTAPSNNGGSAITGYTVRYSSNNGSTYTDFNTNVSSSATSVAVTGLTNGTSYLIQIATKNAYGSSTYNTYAATSPATVPVAPTLLTATPGNSSAYLTWTPGANGGSPITSYALQYTADYNLADNIASWTTATNIFYNLVSSYAVIAGLTNNTAYKFRIAPNNVIGAGSYTSGSNIILPSSSSSTNASPSIISASPGNTSITVRYNAPITTFDSPSSSLIGYVVQYSTDNVNFTTSSDTSGEALTAGTRNITITGLTNDIVYYVRIGWSSSVSKIIYSASAQTTPTELSSLLNAPSCYTTCASETVKKGNDSIILYSNKSSDTLDTTSYTAQISINKVNWTDITSSDPSLINYTSIIIGQNVTSLDNKTDKYYFRVKNNRSYSTGWSPVRTISGDLNLGFNLHTDTAPRINTKTYTGTTSTTISWSVPAVIPVGETINYYAIDKKASSGSPIKGLASWGNAADNNGSAGQSKSNGSSVPVLIGNDSNFTQVAANTFHGAAITSSGQLYSWGQNNYGQVGDGTTQGINYPKKITIGNNLQCTNVSLGTACSAVIASGCLYTWGSNGPYGNLGLGSTGGSVTTPTRVGTSNNWTKVSCSQTGDYTYEYMLAINSLGELYGWGYGYGYNVSSAYPVKIGSANNWTDVCSGNSINLAINSSGQLYSWGGAEFTSSPTRLGSASNWTKVFSGKSSLFAINSSGELYAWGLNTSGQLGLGNTTNLISTPTKVGSATNWVNISSNGFSTLGINSSGQLFAWGNNGSSQLLTTSTSTPVQILPQYSWNDLAVGSAFVVATTLLPAGDWTYSYSTTTTSQTLPYIEAGSFFTVRAVFTNGNSSPRSNVIM